MNNRDLVSIIVPVYGVEAYLPACVDSLLVQTYKNFEIILVDDGSPDGCPAICDAYAAKDPRVHVIHKKNGGAASARNAGLDATQGEYICFVDSDDLVCPNYVEKLRSTLDATDADIAVCGFTQMTRDNETVYADRETAGVFDCSDYIAQFLKYWTCALLWNKIFRREAIGTLRMEEGHRIDDEFFTYQVVLNCRSIAVFDAPLYRYRLRVSSVMQDFGKNSEQIMLDRIDYTKQRYISVVEALPALQALFFLDMTDSFARYWLTCRDMPEAKRKIHQWAIQNMRSIMTSEMTSKQKIVYLYILFLKRSGTASQQPSMRSTANYFP